jgi:hypothetical protein
MGKVESPLQTELRRFAEMNIPFPPPGDEIPRLIPKSAPKGVRPRCIWTLRGARFSGLFRDAPGDSSPGGVRMVFVFLQTS